MTTPNTAIEHETAEEDIRNALTALAFRKSCPLLEEDLQGIEARLRQAMAKLEQARKAK